jgi:hypothetical protein
VTYQIKYYRKGMSVGSLTCAELLAETKEFAELGLRLHDADLAMILDMDNDGIVVKTIKPMSQGSQGHKCKSDELHR